MIYHRYTPRGFRPQPNQKKPRIEHGRNTDLRRKFLTGANRENRGECRISVFCVISCSKDQPRKNTNHTKTHRRKEEDREIRGRKITDGLFPVIAPSSVICVHPCPSVARSFFCVLDFRVF